MILTPHLLAGAAVASKIQYLPLGVAFAFLSHYCLDAIFHCEYRIDYLQGRIWKNAMPDLLKVSLDIFGGIVLVIIFSENILLALTGGFLAILPDGLTFLFLLFPKNWLLKKHYNFHRNGTHFFREKKIPVFLGVLSQVLIAIVSIFFLSR